MEDEIILKPVPDDEELEDDEFEDEPEDDMPDDVPVEEEVD